MVVSSGMVSCMLCISLNLPAPAVLVYCFFVFCLFFKLLEC